MGGRGGKLTFAEMEAVLKELTLAETEATHMG